MSDTRTYLFQTWASSEAPSQLVVQIVHDLEGNVVAVSAGDRHAGRLGTFVHLTKEAGR